MIMSEAGRRVCMTRSQQTAKPGRQIITFLLFANITLWILDTFISNKQITQVDRGDHSSSSKKSLRYLQEITQVDILEITRVDLGDHSGSSRKSLRQLQEITQVLLGDHSDNYRRSLMQFKEIIQIVLGDHSGSSS